VSNVQPQQQYQVRFDWGTAGFRALAEHSDVIILADALPPVQGGAGADSAEAASVARVAGVARVARVARVAGAAGASEAAVAAEVAVRTQLTPHRVITADLRNRAAVADWVLARQAEKGGRFSVAVIAVGESRTDGTYRTAVEDLLVAGAVIDALSDLGIDHCSPEAAAASAGFVGLKRALRHLVSGSESGQALSANGGGELVRSAGLLDDSRDVREITDFAFPA
jgi:2-phosphosulfolactate phosphatase